MNKQKIIPIIFDTYLAVIRNSVGSKMFRNFYAKVNGKKADIMRNGELSCAFYASSILALFGFIKKIHGTVGSTIKDLKDSGWKVTKKPKIGGVLVWEEAGFENGDIHKHIGFYIGGNRAVSNSSKFGRIVEHHLTFGAHQKHPKRKIEAVFWNPNWN